MKLIEKFKGKMKIICIGRNYLDHIIELNNKVPKDRCFSKPQTAIQPKITHFYPDFSNHIEYELEITFELINWETH